MINIPLEIRVFAMARCGHHAIIEWLRKQISGQVPFVNFIKWPVVGGIPQFPHNKLLIKPGTSALIWSEENPSIKVMSKIPKDLPNQPFRSEKVETILIMRDPYNWAASLLKKTRTDGNVKKLGLFMAERIALWKEHAAEALRETDHLKNYLFINYNRWFNDKNYREMIMFSLGLDNYDRGLQEVPDFGEGSSFDLRGFHGRAQEMNVMNRWQLMQDDPLYMEIMEDPELLRYSKELFDFEPIFQES